MSRYRRSASQRYHDRVAGRYESMYDDAYWQWHDGLTWGYMKPALPRDLSVAVVDLGCGSGKWGRRLLKSGYAVTFVDSSAKMVDETRRQVEMAGLSGRAAFVQADLIDLSLLEAESFGLALAMGEPIGCAADPSRAVREIARILAPGGVLVATFDNRVACIDHFVEKGDPAELERFVRTGRMHWLTRDRAEQFEIHAFTPDQIGKLLSAAGLVLVEMIGKTVLPMRQHRELLEDPQARRRWSKTEQRLAREPSNLGRCPHLQVTARKAGARCT